MILQLVILNIVGVEEPLNTNLFITIDNIRTLQNLSTSYWVLVQALLLEF